MRHGNDILLLAIREITVSWGIYTLASRFISAADAADENRLGPTQICHCPHGDHVSVEVFCHLTQMKHRCIRHRQFSIYLITLNLSYQQLTPPTMGVVSSSLAPPTATSICVLPQSPPGVPPLVALLSADRCSLLRAPPYSLTLHRLPCPGLKPISPPASGIRPLISFRCLCRCLHGTVLSANVITGALASVCSHDVLTDSSTPDFSRSWESPSHSVVTCAGLLLAPGLEPHTILHAAMG
ncbi:hypothetical protein VTK26DRAFT_5437 [Humicola hyalothermophila]